MSTEAENLATLIAANKSPQSTITAMTNRLVKLVGRKKALEMIKQASK